VTTLAQGKDVSDFQPVQTVADWKNFDFGFMKASEGTGWKSQTFGTQPDGSPGDWANIKTAGKPRGAYHFLHPGEDIASQVGNFLGVIKAAGGLHPGDMLVVDTEVFDGLTGAQVDTATKAFLDTLAGKIDTTRHPLIVYTMNEVGQFLKNTAAAYPLLWFAWPESTPPPADMIAPWTAWRFWQWGAIRGTDRDAYVSSAADLDTWIKGFAQPTRTVAVVVTDGKESLAKIAGTYGDNPGRVVLRTLAHGHLHPRLALYVVRHPKFQAPMPKGIHLLVATGKAA
jgi:lysozyme